MMAKQRRLRALTTSGVEHHTFSRRDASLVGQHWNAIRRFLEYGDHTSLDLMTGTKLGRGKSSAVLETDLDAIEWHATRGEMSFEDIYSEVV